MAASKLPKATARRVSAETAAAKRADDKPTLITAAVLKRWALPALDGELGKVARGTVLVIGGSDEIPGAALLATIAALRAGAGTAVIATTKNAAPHLAVAVPEARVIGLPASTRGELAPNAARSLEHDLERADAILVGPGMRAPVAAAALLALAAKHAPGTTPLIADAGALEALPRSTRPGHLIITPHAGEMAKLLGRTPEAIAADPITAARDAALALDCIVVLKGAATYITSPNGELFCNTAGNLGLGTSGSGDTLSGIITGLCARGATPMQAAVWGVHIHARAGEVLAKQVAPLGYLARELLAEVPKLIAQHQTRGAKT